MKKTALDVLEALQASRFLEGRNMRLMPDGDGPCKSACLTITLSRGPVYVGLIETRDDDLLFELSGSFSGREIFSARVDCESDDDFDEVIKSFGIHVKWFVDAEESRFARQHDFKQICEAWGVSNSDFLDYYSNIKLSESARLVCSSPCREDRYTFALDLTKEQAFALAKVVQGWESGGVTDGQCEGDRDGR